MNTLSSWLYDISQWWITLSSKDNIRKIIWKLTIIKKRRVAVVNVDRPSRGRVGWQRWPAENLACGRRNELRLCSNSVDLANAERIGVSGHIDLECWQASGSWLVCKDIVAIVSHVEGLDHHWVVEPCRSGESGSGTLVARKTSRSVNSVLFILRPHESGLLRRGKCSECKSRRNL